jgi:type II secretory pathway pseudopilin PulG
MSVVASPALTSTPGQRAKKERSAARQLATDASAAASAAQTRSSRQRRSRELTQTETLSKLQRQPVRKHGDSAQIDAALDEHGDEVRVAKEASQPQRGRLLAVAVAVKIQHTFVLRRGRLNRRPRL